MRERKRREREREKEAKCERIINFIKSVNLCFMVNILDKLFNVQVPFHVNYNTNIFIGLVLKFCYNVMKEKFQQQF